MLEKQKFGRANNKKLLGILIDRNLKFDKYVLSQCIKAGKELSALIKISKLMTLAQRRNIMKAFLNLCLAITHLFGCFAKNKLMHV